MSWKKETGAFVMEVHSDGRPVQINLTHGDPNDQRILRLSHDDLLDLQYVVARAIQVCERAEADDRLRDRLQKERSNVR